MKIKDLMTPVSEYKTVTTTATFADVAAALSESSHRDVIVVNEDGDLVGILTMTDILVAMEPNYKKLGKKDLDSDILSNRYVADLFKEYGLWVDPLNELCKKGAKVLVSDAMYVPDESEYLNEEDDLGHGIHRYIVGVHQPLLVRSNGTITGVLRLSDVFEEIKTRMVTCTD
ncbi:CBS domain-containing protein [Pseudodesulfovibrio sp. zrk46]|uniref:CBS domain-containing protein n=1 Tax=Pseudodesulfovibrio sp. zrk46 TaxID=2725288 RepID=UPI0014491F9A|nr:CBS domain-containing protein [Pseudodesulfovibrio sp. zrk46]QJB57270.1 CBS domain-containing protein [Pseudodesulfovibrio sp. zrk46]